MLALIETPDVVHESLDGEVVVVHLGNGRYFSLTDSAALIWTGLTLSLSDQDLSLWVQHHYEVELATASIAVQGFLEALLQQNLIRRENIAPSPARNWPVVCKSPFTPPEIVAHSDMEGLLMLDPVHDVDKAGWPWAGSTP